jgi:hypothetical protein
MARRRSGAEPGWVRARRALAEGFAAVGAQVTLGRPKRLGGGVWREGWGCEVTVAPDPDGWSGDWVALVPSAPAEPVHDEARLLSWLSTLELGIRVPRVVPPTSEVLVCGWLAGASLERSPDRLEVTAQVARVIHAVEPPDWLAGPATRLAHAEAELALLARFDDPVIQDARAWAADHLPPATRACLLHGDLMAQNVLEHVRLPPGVIDWSEASRGDPASDLALVTRGSRAPFGDPHGLERLVRAVDPDCSQITLAHVHIHELGLLSRHVHEGEPDAAQRLAQLRNLAARVTRSWRR